MKNRINIKPETFTAATADVAQVGEWYAKSINGTVTVQFGKTEMTVWAHKGLGGYIHAYGFVGNYRTGSKDWAVTMSVRPENEFTSVWFGRDDRSGRCVKQNAIRFDPETFFKL